MSVHLLEEMSTPALDALDRSRTAVILTVSPLEEHGPHLPVGVDAFAARHFARATAERLVARRPGWSVVLAPTLHLGSFTFETVGTVSVRQRVVRDALVDYGRALALTREHAARRLTTERQALIAELERAKHDYLTATKGSSF